MQVRLEPTKVKPLSRCHDIQQKNIQLDGKTIAPLSIMTLIINIDCLYGEFLTVILNAVKLSIIKVSVNILSVMAPLSRFHSKSMLFSLALKFKAINPNGYQ